MSGMSIRLSREVRFGVADAGERAVEGGANGFAGNPVMAGVVPFVAVTVTVSGELDRETGMLVNIKTIDSRVREGAVERVRAQGREGVLGIGRLAAVLLEQMTEALAGKVEAVEGVAVKVSPYLQAEARREEMPMVRLSQRFEFSAAHRLHSAKLSEDENWKVFGRCNNPNGHGHNYELEVTVLGAPDAKSGTVIAVPELQKIVNERVIDVFDHKHLNLDCAEFREPGGVNPTVENIARIIYGRLKGAFPSGGGGAKLAGVRLWETPKTMCEYSE
jgi:6-pyruvoyltetrahydropterin/6-carboxytetrahydropterin synthase